MVISLIGVFLVLENKGIFLHYGAAAISTSTPSAWQARISTAWRARVLG
jgi:hypothetical protein